MTGLVFPAEIRVGPAWYAPSRFEAVVTSSKGRVGVGTSEGPEAALAMAFNNAWLPSCWRRCLGKSNA